MSVMESATVLQVSMCGSWNRWGDDGSIFCIRSVQKCSVNISCLLRSTLPKYFASKNA